MKAMPANYHERYLDLLPTISTSKGRRCLVPIMGLANLGALARLNAEKIFQDIQGFILQEKRKVSDLEIQDIISKALKEYQGDTFTPRPRVPLVIKDGKTALQNIISQGEISDQADLLEVYLNSLWGAP